MKVCDVSGCDRLARRKSAKWCGMHYTRWKRHGDPLVSLRPKLGFWGWVNKDAPNGCWLWVGAKASNGYGTATVNRRWVQVHRHAYEELVGPIPDGLQIDHLCRVPLCINPAHLEPVTCAENNRRKWEARRAS